MLTENEKRLQEIEKRLLKAPPEPWSAQKMPPPHEFWRVRDDDGTILADYVEEHIARFLVEARTDLLYLATRVRQLEQSCAFD